VKKICQATNLAQELGDQEIVLQIVDSSVYSPEEAKKNIRAKLTLSDGVSKILCLCTGKAFDCLDEADSKLSKYQIVALNASKIQCQSVSGKQVLIMKGAFKVHYHSCSTQIGSPMDYLKNKESGQFAESYDLKIPGAKGAALDTPVRENLNAALQSGLNLKSASAKKDSDRMYEEAPERASIQPVEESYYTPIKSLNQFNSDWCIKARITKKADLRSWKNARGEGTLLNIDLIDKEGTRIQATFFNDTAQKFDSELQENSVYTFTGGQVKLANKKFTSIKNDYCITFDRDTVIKKCDEDKAIKDVGFSFSSLEQIE